MPSQSEPVLPAAAEPPDPGEIEEAAMQPVSDPVRLPASPAPPCSPADFDRWLRRELGQLYNDVLLEPIPERLLRIVEQGRHSHDS